MNDNGNKLFTETVNLGGVCINRLMRSSLLSEKGIYNIGEFEAMLLPSLVGNDGPALEFWKKGKRKQKFVRITDRFLIIFEESKNEKVTLSDFAGLNINKSMGKYPSFPCFEFTWTGENLIKEIFKGQLKFARVDLNGSNFVSYHYDGFSQKYNCYSPKKIDFQSSDLEFPENLEKFNEILGVPFKRMIDFDKEVNIIKKNLGLEGFHQALLSCT